MTDDLKHETIAMGFAITEEQVDSDLYETLAQQKAAMAQSMQQARAQAMASVTASSVGLGVGHGLTGASTGSVFTSGGWESLYSEEEKELEAKTVTRREPEDGWIVDGEL